MPDSIEQKEALNLKFPRPESTLRHRSGWKGMSFEEVQQDTALLNAYYLKNKDQFPREKKGNIPPFVL